MSSFRDPEQQKKILAVLLVVMAVVFAWRFAVPALYDWARGSDQDRDRRSARARSIATQNVVDVRLGDLLAERASYTPNRNIFRYGQKKAPPPPPPPEPTPVKPDFTPKPPPPPPPPPPPQHPPVPFKVLGVFGPEDRRLAVLIDGEEITNAFEQDVLRDTFIIDEIGLESVLFGFVNFPDDTERVEISGSR